LLVAGLEGLDLEVGQQPFHLAVGQLAAFDPGGKSPRTGSNVTRKRPEAKVLERVDPSLEVPGFKNGVRHQSGMNGPRMLRAHHVEGQVQRGREQLQCGCDRMPGRPGPPSFVRARNCE
jgi:hypothetical protein